MIEEKFQNAMKGRLAKLGGMPLDMTGVEKAVKMRIIEAEMDQKGADLGAIDSEMRAKGRDFAAEAGVEGVSQTDANDKQLSANEHQSDANRQQSRSNLTVRAARFWRPAAAVAASLVLIAIVGMALLQGRPAQASAMVQLHRDIMAGKVHTMPVDSVAEVNEAFAAFGKNGVRIEAPQMAVMSCCMQHVEGKQVYCVQLKEEGVPVTLTIADAAAVAAPKTTTVMHKGAAYHVEASGELTMVTTEHGGRRVCLIGALPAERLMGLAEGLKL
jgi:hypothetical protein